MAKKKKKKINKNTNEVSTGKRWFISFVSVVMLLASYTAYDYYKKIYGSNISLGIKKSTYFYIPTNATFNKIVQSLFDQGYIIDKESFAWVATQKNFVNRVLPGRYLLKDNMSNNELVNLLRSGKQTPVQVTFNNIRTINDLAGKLAKVLEPDSISFLKEMQNEKIADSLGFNLSTFSTLIIPNTYEFYWNTGPRKFINRMAQEYKLFWNESRKAKARKIGFSQSEVGILASIVKAETSKKDEASRVAGVYVNRLNKEMALQADPTLIWALKDFTIKRVLLEHKKIDSPYNTYKHKGLPPGPINLPERNYIDAVLNYEKHQFLYFCAKEDFSGYHNFASNYAQHLVNARKYQKALNKRNIYR